MSLKEISSIEGTLWVGSIMEIILVAYDETVLDMSIER